MADAATKIFELQDEIERLLRKSDLSLLENIAFAINVEEEMIHGKNKQQVLKLIQEVFDSVEDTSEKLVVFSNLVSLIPSQIKDKYTELLMPLLRNQDTRYKIYFLNPMGLMKKKKIGLPLAKFLVLRKKIQVGKTRTS